MEKKTYITPQQHIIELDNNDHLLQDSNLDIGSGGGPGSSAAKENVWGWGWDEEW